MSEHSTVDEITGEVSRFSAAMQAAIQRHAQSRGWMERRRARKDISRLIRQERHEQDRARTNHLAWTNQAVDRYRMHAVAVAARAGDPSVDHYRRAHDARALAEHRDTLAGQFIEDEHLTRTEQGIALDGLDAATVFPEYRPGNLFSRAHKVKGIEALHYRARVARETVGARQHAEREQAEWEKGLDAARRANAEASILARIDAAQAHRHRYTAQMTWTDPDGGVLSETRAFATEHTATAWAKRNVDHTMWSDGTSLQVRTIDTINGATQHADQGRPEIVARQLAQREAILRERTLRGQVHHDQQRFGATVTYLPDNANQVVYETGSHASESESAAWTARQLGVIQPAAGTTVHVAAYQHTADGDHDPVFRAEGGPQMVADEVTQWREGVDRGSVQRDRGETEQRPAWVEQLTPERAAAAHVLREAQRQWNEHALTASVDRRMQLGEACRAAGDDLRKTGLNWDDVRWVTDHPGDVDRRLAEIDRDQQPVTATPRQVVEGHDQRDTTITELTRQLEQVTGERDKFRGERDEAVQKLAARTPAHRRYGSPERQAEQAKPAAMAGRSALADYQPGNSLADALAQTGADRTEVER
ncbi:hypothetical protein [Nocardia sp. CNY236]|uniref:hypothetical protein n=1 Tax=Nocardia sp. CNY236 TaxID=1169152 RepID=UPI000400991D|nr:hypothetical protein [Nocardia sp. CNY236]